MKRSIRSLRSCCEEKLADSDEGGHRFRSDRGHHSNLMAARLVSSRRPVFFMSWRLRPGQAVWAETHDNWLLHGVLIAPVTVANRNHRRPGSQQMAGRAHNHCTRPE